MTDLYANGEKLTTSKDLKQINDKIKIDAPMFVQVNSNDELNKTLADIKGQNTSGLGLRFRFIRTTYDNPSGILANYGGGIQFGMNGMVGMINLNALKSGAQIGVSKNGQTFYWTEALAFQSDIDALKARISALEKQIGGVLSSALSHLKLRIEVVA